VVDERKAGLDKKMRSLICRLSKKFKVVLISALPIAILIAAVFTFYEAEQGSHPGLGVWEVIEKLFIALMGEYPDQPDSVVARIVQLVLLAFSTVLVGAIIGKISALFVANSLNKDKKMNVFKDHIIICNWNEKAKGIISELLKADKLIDIVVACSSVVEDGGLFGEDRIIFKQCDPTHHDVLDKQLCAKQARCVILLADEEVSNPDDKNALIALAIKNLENDTTRETKIELDIHVVAELTSLDRKRHMLEAGADEVISSVDYASGIIAQSAMHEKMSVVYDKLLSYSDDTNEVYFISGEHDTESGKKMSAKYPGDFIGKSFPELVAMVNEIYASCSSPVLLIGIKREKAEKEKDRVMLNPKKSVFETLQLGDDLIVMSFEKIEVIG